MTNESVAAARSMPTGAAAAGDSVPGRQRAGFVGEAATERTISGAVRRSGQVRAHGGPSAIRTGRDASDPGADDARVSNNADIDMTGAATFAGVAETGRTNEPEGVQTPTSRAAELAEQVADRILVSVPEPGAPREVRISLKQSLLDGSDVRIFREGGNLKVVFVAETESAQQFLADNKALMQQTLGDRLRGQSVQVEVEMPNRGQASRDDSRRRSRQQYVRDDESSDAN